MSIVGSCIEQIYDFFIFYFSQKFLDKFWKSVEIEGFFFPKNSARLCRAYNNTGGVTWRYKT